jgi:prepilin-type N-terminal cleavage/methylation domain-containing protein/prepilin-type processing-associated H-X9-DG protein
MKTSSLRARSSAAFTLVELLVVIAIIGILVGLLLPAVQSARESGRQLQCRNNLKQMATAALAHDSSQGTFVHGGWGFQCVGLPDKGFGPKQPGGWIFSLLPFMEQGNLYNQTDLKLVVSTPQPWLHCPTRRRAIAYPAGPTGWQPFWTGTLTKVAKTDYAINGGTGSIDYGGNSDKNTPPPMAVTDGIAGRAWVVKRARISDGLSNTYLLGEKWVNPDFYQTTDGDWGDNELAYIGSDRDTLRTANPPYRDRRGIDYTYSFGSAHSSGFNMALCDGSVRPISYAVDITLHQRMVKRADGQVVNQSGL